MGNGPFQILRKYYLYFYGVIRTDLDLANEKAILLGSTSNRFLDDVDAGRMKIYGWIKLVVARYPKNALYIEA